MGRTFSTLVIFLGLSLSRSIGAPQEKGKGISKGKSTTQKKPKALKQSLPKLPPGVRRGVIGDDLILVAEGSEKILEIVRNVSSTVEQVF